MEIHEKYQQLSKEIVAMARSEMPGEPYILKTDCWNEAHTAQPIAHLFKHIICVDAWDEKVDMARNLGFQVDRGNVTRLPYNDTNFDVLIDLSTIDHVKDYNLVLSEYQRVLKQGGYVLIVCWFNAVEEFHNAGNPMLDQYFFKYDEFIAKFNEKFEFIKSANVAEDADISNITGRTLIYIMGKKK